MRDLLEREGRGGQFVQEEPTPSPAVPRPGEEEGRQVPCQVDKLLLLLINNENKEDLQGRGSQVRGPLAAPHSRDRPAASQQKGLDNEQSRRNVQMAHMWARSARNH
jgi:hypothetical protein